MVIQVTKLNSEGNPTTEPKDFATIKQAQKWCEEDRGAKLEWEEEGRLGLEGMTKEEADALNETAEYPPVRYWVVDSEDL